MKTTNVFLIFLGLKAKEIGKGLEAAGIVLGFFVIILGLPMILLAAMVGTNVWVCLPGFILIQLLTIVYVYFLPLYLLGLLGYWIYENWKKAKIISKERKAKQ